MSKTFRPDSRRPSIWRGARPAAAAAAATISGDIHHLTIDLVRRLEHRLHHLRVLEIHKAKTAAPTAGLVHHDDAVRLAELLKVGVQRIPRAALRQATNECLQVLGGPAFSATAALSSTTLAAKGCLAARRLLHRLLDHLLHRVVL